MEELRKYFDEINAETGEPTGSLQGKEQAVKNAERIPFSQDWFVFGEDHYFWLI